jgi:hypothetical protein
MKITAFVKVKVKGSAKWESIEVDVRDLTSAVVQAMARRGSVNKDDWVSAYHVAV